MPWESRKSDCILATTANIDLATIGPGSVLEGRTLQQGDRILVRAQTDPAENGIYEVTSGGIARASDADDAEDWFDDFVVYAGTQLYRWNKPDNFQLGTTAILFEPLTTAIITTGTGYPQQKPLYVPTPYWIGLQPGRLYAANGQTSREAIETIIETYGRIHFPAGEWLIDSAIDLNVEQVVITADPGAVLKLAPKIWTAATYLSRYGIDLTGTSYHRYDYAIRATRWLNKVIISGLTIDLNASNRIYDDPTVPARGRLGTIALWLLGQNQIIEDVTIQGIAAAEADTTAGYDTSFVLEPFVVYCKAPNWTVSGQPDVDLSQDQYFQGPTIRRLTFAGPIQEQTYEVRKDTPEISLLAVAGATNRRWWYRDVVIEDIVFGGCQKGGNQHRTLHGITVGHILNCTIRGVTGTIGGPAIFYWAGPLINTIISDINVDGGALSIGVREQTATPTVDLVQADTSFDTNGELWLLTGENYGRVGEVVSVGSGEVVYAYEVDSNGNPANPTQLTAGQRFTVKGPILITGTAGNVVQSQVRVNSDVATVGIRKLLAKNIQARPSLYIDSTYQGSKGITLLIEPNASTLPQCAWNDDGYWLDDIVIDGGIIEANQEYAIYAHITPYSGSLAQSVARAIRLQNITCSRRNSSGIAYSRANVAVADPPMRYIQGWVFDVRCSTVGSDEYADYRTDRVWLRNAAGTSWFPQPEAWLPSFDIYLYTNNTKRWLMRHPDELGLHFSSYVLARRYVIETRATGCGVVLPYYSGTNMEWTVGRVGYNTWCEIVNLGPQPLDIYQANTTTIDDAQTTLLTTLQAGETYRWSKRYGD